MAQITIDNFVNTMVAFHRPIKRTYFILRWDSNIRRWRKYSNEDHEIGTLHRSNSLPPASCKLYIKNGRNTYNITIRADGYFLNMGGDIIPIVERTAGQIKQSSIGTEYTTRELVDQTLYNENIELWSTRNAVVNNDIQVMPPLLPTGTGAAATLTAMREYIDNYVETNEIVTDEYLPHIAYNYIAPIRPIPQRVARLLVEEAVRNNESCAIDLAPLTLEGSAVTSCFHVFSEPHLSEWFQRNQTSVHCPVCRARCAMTRVVQA